MHWLGVAGMPRRIPDYPDAFYLFNKIASWGSYISAASFVFFFVVIFEAFYSSRNYVEDTRAKNSLNFFDVFIVILGVISYFVGYVFITLYTLVHVIVRLLQNVSPVFADRLDTFKMDQQTIREHYLEDFWVFYYFVFFIRIVSILFYGYFFFILSPEDLILYEFMFYSITYVFILTTLLDLGIIIYIILYKNNPVKEVALNICYHCVTKGIPVCGALHVSSNVPVISPNPVSNTYHLHSPFGRGYGAYSSMNLVQVDILKGHLGSNFDYSQCVDGKSFLDPNKLQAYAKKNNISLELQLQHTHSLANPFKKTS